MRYSIVDENGEIVGSLNEGDRIIRKKSVDMLCDTQVWDIKHFYKGNIDEVRKQNGNLDVYEKALIYSIATYIGYEDCCLKHDNGKQLDFDGIVGISGMSRGKVSSTMNSLVAKDIMYKGKNSKGIQYFVNPWLFCKGKRINKVLKSMFRNYRIQVLGGTKWEEIMD